MLWAGDEDDAVGLQALVLAVLELAFDGAGLVNQDPAQAITCGAPLPKSHLDQATLACKDLG